MHENPIVNPVTIAVYHDQREAQLIKTLLESRGYPCLLRDEVSVQMYGSFASTAQGGIKLMVAQTDAEPALQWLYEMKYIQLPSGHKPSLEHRINARIENLAGRSKITRGILWTGFVLLMLYILMRI